MSRLQTGPRPQAADSVADWSNEPDADALFAAQDIFRSDPDAAIRRLEDLVSLGSIRAMVQLAWMYSFPSSAVVDVTKAESWYRRSIDQGAKDAPYLFGVFLDKGSRHDEAFRYYRLGNDWGHTPAMYRLGCAYYNGRGVDKNLEKARHVFEQAAHLGHLFATRQLILLYLSGRFGSRNFFRAWQMMPAILADLLTVYRRDPHSDLLK